MRAVIFIPPPPFKLVPSPVTPYAPKLDDPVIRREVCRRQIERTKTELAQRPYDPLTVRGVRPNEQVQVLSEARPAVECDRVSANDQEFNVVLTE